MASNKYTRPNGLGFRVYNVIWLLASVWLLLTASTCQANVSFVASRPTGPERFFANILRRADALPAFAYRTAAVISNDHVRGEHNNKTTGGGGGGTQHQGGSSSIEALLHDAFFGRADFADQSGFESSGAFVGNIQATIIILSAAICLSLGPKRNNNNHNVVEVNERPSVAVAPSASSEMGEVLGSAVSLGVMLIGTSVSVAIRHSATSAQSADLLFYMGIMTCLVCLALEHMIAAYQTNIKQKRVLLFILSLGMLFAASSISRKREDATQNSFGMFRVLFSMKDFQEPVSSNLIEVLPVFAGFSAFFSLGFLVLLSYDLDGSSSSAIGSMCLLQILIAGSSVLRSAVVFQMHSNLIQTSFAFVLACVLLGSSVSARMLAWTMDSSSSTNGGGGVGRGGLDGISPNADKSKLMMKPFSKRMVRFKDDDHLVEYFEHDFI